MPDPKPRASRSRTTVADLVDAGVLAAGDALYFSSTRVTITAGGQPQAADGQQPASPTDAATVLSGSIRNGWDCWRRRRRERSQDQGASTRVRASPIEVRRRAGGLT